MPKYYSVTPSFLLKLMKHSSKLENELDVINAFEKLSEHEGILTSDSINLEDDKEDENVPKNLLDLYQALEGAVSEAEEQEAYDSED